MTPNEDEIHRAVDTFYIAMGGLIRFAEEGDLAMWHHATGYLQDALAELGFDLLPLKEPPPATPEAIYDDEPMSW